MLEDLSSLDAFGGDQIAEREFVFEMVGEEVIFQIGLVFQLLSRSDRSLLPGGQHRIVADLIGNLL